MHLVLDNVSQGLLVLDRDARPARERSAVVERLFGAVEPEATFGDMLAQLDARAAIAFRLNWEQLLEGVLPAELSIDQLPRVVRFGECEYAIDYTPLLNGMEFERMLVVVSDVTEQRAIEREERRAARDPPRVRAHRPRQGGFP